MRDKRQPEGSLGRWIQDPPQVIKLHSTTHTHTGTSGVGET